MECAEGLSPSPQKILKFRYLKMTQFGAFWGDKRSALLSENSANTDQSKT